MNDIRIPFSPPDITEEEIAEVVKVLRSGWITTGSKTKQFEKEISKYCGTDFAVCMSSQTACAEMTLRLLGISEGDEVIVPAYTYTATASVVCHVGATPVMIDCQKDCFEMDYDQLGAAITPRTKVIIPVDVAGIPCDYARIYEIVEKHRESFTSTDNDIQRAFGRIIIMSDGAHSFGAVKDGKKSGQFADFTNTSFHAVKNLTTAEGGAVMWRPIPGIDSEEIYRRYSLLSLHGQTKNAFEKDRQWEYDIVSTAYKANMTDIQAAMGLTQLRRYDEILDRRHEIIRRYDEAFKDLNVKLLCHSDDRMRSSGHLYFVRFIGKDETFRNHFYQCMYQNGVCCNVHYKPLPAMTAYRNLGYRLSDCPNAYRYYQNELTLPLNTCMSDIDVQYVIETFLKVYNELF